MHQELVVHQWDCERGIECASRWEIEIECTVRTKEKCSSHLKLISVQLSLDRNGLKRSSSLQNSFSVSCHLLTQNFQGQWMQWVSFLSKWQNQMNGLTLQARVCPDKCLSCRPRCNDFYWYWTTDLKNAKMLKRKSPSIIHKGIYRVFFPWFHPEKFKVTWVLNMHQEKKITHGKFFDFRTQKWT